jgi:hypothetical protein
MIRTRYSAPRVQERYCSTRSRLAAMRISPALGDAEEISCSAGLPWLAHSPNSAALPAGRLSGLLHHPAPLTLLNDCLAGLVPVGKGLVPPGCFRVCREIRRPGNPLFRKTYVNSTI